MNVAPKTSPAVRISVVGRPGSLAEQIRAYAEYRVFSRLAMLWPRIDAVQLTVIDGPEAGGVTCEVRVAAGREHLQSVASGAHPVGAIDAATQDLAHEAARRLTPVPG